MLPGRTGWAPGVGGGGVLLGSSSIRAAEIWGLEVLAAGFAQTLLDPTVFCHSGSKLSRDDEEFNCYSR